MKNQYTVTDVAVLNEMIERLGMEETKRALEAAAGVNAEIHKDNAKGSA